MARPVESSRSKTGLRHGPVARFDDVVTARISAGLIGSTDESGFLLIPYGAKTWPQQGCTAVHYYRQRRREKVSVISGISVSPRHQRLSLFYFDNIGQEEVCMFLLDLLRHLRGPVIVLLDNSSTHQEHRCSSCYVGIAVCTSSTFLPN